MTDFISSYSIFSNYLGAGGGWIGGVGWGGGDEIGGGMKSSVEREREREGGGEEEGGETRKQGAADVRGFNVAWLVLFSFLSYPFGKRSPLLGPYADLVRTVNSSSSSSSSLRL